MKNDFPVVTYKCGHRRMVSVGILSRQGCFTTPAPDFSTIVCPLCESMEQEKRKIDPQPEP